ncbi:LD-carboxypeptidase [Rhizobium sp. XQZ8]|uniref:S66 peptidase family protein n=1 Tax=Rhizobium populisoli TaxID=2859785 RepID=UPI001C66CBEF|nr:LD-carboxypeptidase [Rhizobium populisoli]MBW6423767.1 LD-carboxypeptidase [Rhizobium populisoli]
MAEPLFPAKIKKGDRIRFVSPASTPDREMILRRADRLRDMGFEVDFGTHAFAEHGFYAGTHEERLADLNEALSDPQVRAVFATRGGRGSYRIADGMDFDAVLRDPKPLLGFSDITALHMMLMRRCGLVGLHGALYGDDEEASHRNSDILMKFLMETGAITFAANEDEVSAKLTTSGRVEGRLVGGNLETLATMTGWGLPSLDGAILLIEAVDCMPGLTDRTLTLLMKSGALNGIAGIAVGQFTLPSREKGEKIIAIVDDHIRPLGIPILGGLPFGHGKGALTTPIGTMAVLDADAGRLTVDY